DQIAVIGTLASGATASVHVREAVAGGIGWLWEINGTDGTLRVTADAAFPGIFPVTVAGAQGRNELAELSVPAALTQQGPALTICELPVPTPAVGWVLIDVKAFGLNRSEVHTRQGLASGVTFPRVPGIEAVGVVARCPGGEFPVGQQVATMMGGMGRTFDGGYAEYTCVPASQVIAFASELEWSTLGAVPEMLQTASGSLTVGLDAQPG